MKKNMIFSGAMSMMTALLLCTACSSDDLATDKATAAVPAGKVIHYTATVGEGDETRATLNSSKKYEFQTDDKLVITGENISGELTLTGTPGTTATFEGDLTYTGSGTPADNLELKAVLVSESNAMIKLEYDEATYPTTAIASTLAEAVEKYSHFTATSTYGEKNFKVSQQTAFLNFTVTFGEGTSTSGALDITIKNDGETVRTGSVTAATGGSNAVAQFVAAMPKGTTMSGATVQLGSNSAISFGGTTTLVANKIYKISKNVGRVAVDLGLSVKWASMNVGATSESDYGLFFAWGETTGYSSVYADPMTDHDFSWANYNWSAGSKNGTQFSKYVPTAKTANWGGSGDTPDGKTTLDPDDDAATANWGGSWRMPTKADFEELLNNTDKQWVNNYNNTGVSGYKFTSKTDASKSIFLPAVGFRYGTSLGNQFFGYYWSSTLHENYPDAAWILKLTSGSAYVDDLDRYYGFSVRPVQSN